MRWLLLCLLFLPTVHAWSDTQGDVVLHSDAGDADHQASHIDLLGLEIVESAAGFEVWCALADLQSEMDDYAVSGSEIRVPIKVHGDAFEVRMGRGAAGGIYYWGSLWHDGERMWGTNTFGDDRFLVDEGASRLGLKLSRADLGWPAPGDVLRVGDVQATSDMADLVPLPYPEPATRGKLVAMDTMAGGEQPVVLGVPSAGVVVRSLAPVAYSNGEAASHVFTVHAASEQGGLFTIDLLDVPDTWSVQAPAAIELAPGENATFPVVATVPFAHAHGRTEHMLVRLSGEAGSGGMALGVHAFDVPQPAGHHDTLYMHSRAVLQGPSRTLQEVSPGAPRPALFLSTLADDPADTGEAIPAEGTPDNDEIYWISEMQPGWALDLDIVDGQGMFVARVDTPVSGIGGTWEARVLARGIDGDGPTRFGTAYQGHPTQSLFQGELDLPWTGGVMDLEIPLMPEVLGRVPVPEDGQIIVELVFHSEVDLPSVTPAMPVMLPGTSMRLPLSEVSVVAEAVIETPVEVVPAERLANPGDVLVFDIDASHSWRVAGPWRDSATVDGARLVVEVPADAAIGQRVRVFIVGDPGVGVALVEVVETPVADDAALLEVDAEAPGPGAAVLLAVLAVSGARRAARRSR